MTIYLLFADDMLVFSKNKGRLNNSSSRNARINYNKAEYLSIGSKDFNGRIDG